MNDHLARLRAAGTAATLFFALISGAVARADTAPADYYDPPKLVKQGTATTPIAGNGTVRIQVLVNPDGSFKVQKIENSTNHGNDQAAMEMANTAKYAPATKGGKKVSAFYTYELKFIGAQASSSDSGSSAAMAQYNAQIRAGNYDAARTGLNAYLQAHPNDAEASVLAGVADTFLNDYPAAAAAFDKGGTIPPRFIAVAARAYASAADKAIAAKDGAAAVAAARKATELAPSVATINLLGTAQEVAHDYAGAVQSFERARTEAASNAKITDKEKAVISVNLAGAYLDLNQPEKAVALLPVVKQLDPASATSGETLIINYYAGKAVDANKAGDAVASAAFFDKAASVGPAHAGEMYAQEAAVLTTVPKPDWKAVKSVADRALAANPESTIANYIAGLALANSGNAKDAVPYFQKASASAKAAGDKATADKADQALRQLSGGK